MPQANLGAQPPPAGHLPLSLLPLADELVAAAQAEYDRWDETDTDFYAGGGICHLIADAQVTVLAKHGVEAASVTSNFEVHVMVACQAKEGIFLLDVPHSLYERGAGYSWTKLPEVRFDNHALSWTLLDRDTSRFHAYLDS